MGLTRLGQKLLMEMAVLVQQYGGPSTQIGNALKNVVYHFKTGSAIFIVPERVHLDWIRPLKLFWCKNCGIIIHVARSSNVPYKCPECGSGLLQAPLFALFPRETPKSAPPEALLPIIPAPSKYTKHIRLTQKDYMRPLRSLRLKWGTQERRIFSPKGYAPVLSPTESLTKPLSISVFDYSSAEITNIEVPERFKGIEGLLLLRNVRVLQVTLGIMIGHPRVSKRKRILKVMFDESGRPLLPSRILSTVGLLIRVRKDVVKKFNEKERLPLLHTLSHLFLVNVPLLSGLDAVEFGEAWDIKDGEVLVYDNVQGGIGGVESCIDGNKLHPNLIERVVSSLLCPLECPKACRACLYSEACYLLNYFLDKRAVLERGVIEVRS